MQLLDRYVLRCFLEPLWLCFGAFLGLWVLFDFSNTGVDLIRHGASLLQLGSFYLVQLPQIILLSFPVALLLATLACGARLSRSNELVAMLTAGRSLPRAMAPLFGAALLASLGCLWLNYEQAPLAESRKEAMKEEVKNPQKPLASSLLQAKSSKPQPVKGQFRGHLYRDRVSNRTWFIERMRVDEPDLFGVLVLEHNPDGDVVRKLYAKRATYEPVEGTWAFRQGLVVDVTPEGIVQKTQRFESPSLPFLVHGWRETPRRIVAANLDPQQLSTPRLSETLQDNRDFPAMHLAKHRTVLADRWAFPWSCLAVVCFGVPLAVVFSRRGSVQGMGWAILLVFFMLISRHFLQALGKGAWVSPLLAAWGPLAFFFLLGLVLLWFRSTNRDAASLFSRK